MLKVAPFVGSPCSKPAGKTLLFADYGVTLDFLCGAKVVFSAVTVEPAAIPTAPFDVNPPHTRVVNYLKELITMKAATGVGWIWFAGGGGFSIQPIMFVVVVAGGVMFCRWLPSAHSFSSVRRRLFSGAVGATRP
jgi:hypothetical protein